MALTNRKYFILLGFVLPLSLLIGQVPSEVSHVVGLTKEHLDIQTDRQLYVTGEVLWFKLIALDSDHLPAKSKVGYIELIGPDGTVSTRVKTELVDGRGAGSISLSKGLNSNLYTLRSYTQMMRNFDSKAFANHQVYILNSEQSLLADNDKKVKSPSKIESALKTKNEIDVKLELSDTQIGQRKLVELKIITSNSSAIEEVVDLSVSVSIPNSTFSEGSLTPNILGTQELSSTEVYLPEFRGMKLTGSVLNAFSNAAEEGIRVYLSFTGSVAMVYTAFTDAEGRFDFLLPRLYGQRQVVLQLDPKTEGDYSIVLDDDFHPNVTTEEERFTLQDELLPIANRILVNAQIDDSYASFEVQPDYQSNEKFAEIPFYGKPDKVYKLDDYTRFPLPEFFYEVVPEVRVFGTYGNNSLGLLNGYLTSKRELTPLLLVDGVPVFDQKNFLSINNKLIVSSEIVKDPYWVNTILYNGIINLLSVDGDARSFSLPESSLRTNFLTYLPERQFSSPDYNLDDKGSLPDFRNTLYWNPSITTDENGEATISFYTSDAIGDYEVKVHAIGKSGQAGGASTSIEVVRSASIE